jgi:dihydropyrimidinase
MHLLSHHRSPRARFSLPSTNPARIFGIFPRKGTIAVGSDADIVLWDQSEVRTIQDSDLFSNAGYSIYSGTRVSGWPKITIRRGEVVFEKGKIFAKPGSGRLLVRDSH